MKSDAVSSCGCRGRPGWRFRLRSRASRQIAVTVEEELRGELDGEPVQVRELAAPHGGRVHALDSGVGALVVDYSATVTGVAEPLGADELELLTYLQPSRYCES